MAGTSDSEVHLLVDAIQALSCAADIQVVQQVVKTAARELVQADGATFVLRDGDQCHYVDEDAIGPLWKGQRFPMSACISGWVMLHREPATIPDIYRDSRVPCDAYRPTFVQSLAMMPIRTRDPIGAIGVYWGSRHDPTSREVDLLSALADSTSVAVENVRMAGEMRVRPSMPGTEVVRVCAWTKQVQLEGRWVPFDTYLRERFGLLVTHGMSEDAYAILEPPDTKPIS